MNRLNERPSFGRQATYYFLALGVFISTLLGFYFISLKFRERPKHQKPVVSVSVGEVVEKDVNFHFEAVGHVEALNSVVIIPEVTGKITAIKFKPGDFVTAGQVLFEIDKSVYEAKLRQAEAQLSVDEARLKLHSLQLERTKDLIDKQFVSKQQFDQYKANVEEFKARVKLDNAVVDQARIQLEKCSVKSPIDGKAGDHLVKLGNMVGGQRGALDLTTVKSVDQLLVSFSLPEKHFHHVWEIKKNGNSLGVEIRSLDDRTVCTKGDLVFLDNKIDIRTGTFALKGQIDNSANKFWPGSSVTLKLNLKKIPNALLVPDAAVQYSQKGPYVFVVKEDSTVEFRLVELGQKNDGLLVIKDGVNLGEKVVLDGHVMLAPGSSVKIVN